MSGITAEQYGFLTSALNPKRVKHVQGQAHLEAWDVRRHLIRCFGFARLGLRAGHLRWPAGSRRWKRNGLSPRTTRCRCGRSW
jgi:hypothetical protein